MQTAVDTVVLIAGGGPIGLTAAIELGWRGIPTIMVTERGDTAQHPKCNSTNSRSMEHFRRLGIARALRAAALPPSVERASSYVTRFCGHEFGRLPRPHASWPTPEIPNNISQIVLERELRRHAEAQAGVQVRFSCKLLSFEAGTDGIVAQVQSAAGECQTIRARYLIGADGASSGVRKALGITMNGEDGSTDRAFMGGTMLSWYIRAPELTALSGRKLAHSTWIINAEMRGLMFSQDGKETWVVHYQVPAGIDWRSVDALATLRALLGSATPFEIISGGPWTGGLAMVAERYQVGNVFLAGDAAHLFTPLGGMGMNTGIGDIMNLCWKIQAEVQGWAGPGLLASYDIERRPIGVRNAGFGVKCSRVMDGWVVPPAFEDDTAAAQAARATLGAQILVEDVPQYLSAGLQLGERYEGSPIVCEDGRPPPPDRWDVYTPIDRPGARVPHFWLGEGEAAYDRFGPGFTLLNFGAATDGEALEAAARARGVPLATLRLDRPDGLFNSTLVLVRPDQHIAWHGASANADEARAIVDRLRGA